MDGWGGENGENLYTGLIRKLRNRLALVQQYSPSCYSMLHRLGELVLQGRWKEKTRPFFFTQMGVLRMGGSLL